MGKKRNNLLLYLKSKINGDEHNETYIDFNDYDDVIKKDCKRIENIAKKNNIEIDIYDAYIIWELYSWSYSAHWLDLSCEFKNDKDLEDLLINDEFDEDEFYLIN